MHCVSDTSVLIALSAIGHLPLLPLYFERVLIPRAVHEELQLESERTGTAVLRQAVEQPWISVREAQQRALIQTLQIDLHPGEAETIALALEEHIPLVLMDDSLGRQRARTLGLQTVGVLGILLRARLQGNIPSLRQAMQDLRKQVGFYIAEPLYLELLRHAQEQS